MQPDEASEKAAERKALWLLTGPCDYLRINQALRSGTIDEVQLSAADSRDVTEYLRTLPEFQGTVYRRVRDDLSEKDLSRYRPGNRVVENGYTHTTLDPTFEFGNGNAYWIVESKRGRIVGEKSLCPQEQEVTFDRFSQFTVLDNYWDDKKEAWIITMDEL